MGKAKRIDVHSHVLPQEMLDAIRLRPRLGERDELLQ